MAAIGFGFLFLVFALVLPLALYWFVRGEDPDPGETASWDDARDRASRDTYGSGRRERDDGDDRESRDDDAPQGNHWS